MTRGSTRRRSPPPPSPKNGAPTKARSRRAAAPPDPQRRTFRVSLTVEISIDPRLLADVLTEEWRSRFYNLRTAGDVAGHLVFNLVQGRSLGSLDGFGNQGRDRARIEHVDVLDDDLVEEVAPPIPDAPASPKPRTRRTP